MPGSASHRLLLIGAGCLALAAASLLVADQPAYDPTAWLIWGRQISEGTLETIAGPSWKPLPVLVTAPAALLGDGPAPLIWLLVARAAGLFAVVLAYRLAARFGGVLAGVVAVASLLLATGFMSGVVRGNSEGLLVALVLGALLAHFDGRLRLALGLSVAAALLRPEVWPLLALYGLWLLREDRRRGEPLGPTLLLLGAGAVLVALLWFVPERIGSGDFLRAASRAREPVADSPAQADRPFLAVFTNSAPALVYPVYVLAGLAVADAWRRRRDEVLVVAALATAWMVLVAILAELGFTGNLRYVTMPVALVCVLAGAGAPLLGRLAGRRRWVVALAVLAAVPGAIIALGRVSDDFDAVRSDERMFDALPAAIAEAGGRDTVRRCGEVLTGAFDTQAVAWELHVKQQDVGLRGDPPGTILARPGSPLSRDDRYPLVARDPQWTVRSTCAG